MSMITSPLPAFLEVDPPRPHPYTCRGIRKVLLSHIPRDISPDEVTAVMRRYGPVIPETHEQISSESRLKPDVFYQGMPYSMTMEYELTKDLEWAVIGFPMRLASRGVTISIIPSMDPIPNPESESTPRMVSIEGANSLFADDLAGRKKFYELVLVWGSLWNMQVLFARHMDACTFRLHFCVETEAQRFTELFASWVNDWNVKVWSASDPQYPGPSAMLTPPTPYVALPFGPVPPFPHDLPPPSFCMNMPTLYSTAYPDAAAVPGFRRRAYSVEMPVSIPMVMAPRPHSMPTRTIPLPPRVYPVIRPAPAIWELYRGVDKTGLFRLLGLKNQYGETVLHKPGQYVMPQDGPVGPSGVPKLIDQCNLRVRGLRPDINDFSFRQLWEHMVGFMGSHVCREERGRPKGYGFACFTLPQHAAAAMAVTQGQKLGDDTLSIAFHEPTKLKIEKQPSLVYHGGV